MSDDIMKSLNSLVKYNNGLFKSEKQGKFLLSRCQEPYTYYGSGSLGDGQTWSGSYQFIYKLDDNGVINVHKSTPKSGVKLTWERISDNDFKSKMKSDAIKSIDILTNDIREREEYLDSPSGSRYLLNELRKMEEDVEAKRKTGEVNDTSYAMLTDIISKKRDELNADISNVMTSIKTLNERIDKYRTVLNESTNTNMSPDEMVSIDNRIYSESNLILDHGADDKYTSLKDNTFLCESGSYVPKNYAENVGGYIITCKVDSLKVLDICNDNSGRLQEYRGMKISGSDPLMYSFLAHVISEDVAERYKKKGLRVFSRVLNDNTDLNRLISYAKSKGCDALKFMDESFDTYIQDITYVVFDGDKLNVIKITDPETDEVWEVSE
jgi:chaperonin cofactor prefoldin